MSCYCLFYVRSNAASLPDEMLRRGALARFDFSDAESAREKASANRLAQRGVRVRKPFRFTWVLSSKGKCDGDLFQHLKWILKSMRPSYHLPSLRECGGEYGISVFWEGNGTGGGPNISVAVSELLVSHQIPLDIAFYLQTGDE